MMLTDEIKESRAIDGDVVIPVCRILPYVASVCQSGCRSDVSVVVPSEWKQSQESGNI